MRISDVQVIATTVEGTRVALAEAGRLASRGDSPRIVLLVPEMLSPFALTKKPAGDRHVLEQYQEMVRAAGLPATVRLCVCRRFREVCRWMIHDVSLVVIGGRRRWWWPTAAERMVRDLERAGHRVVFADVG